MSNVEEMPICPICGDDTNDFYVSDGKVVGCPHCIKETDAWEYNRIEQEGKMIDMHYDRWRDRNLFGL